MKKPRKMAIIITMVI